MLERFSKDEKASLFMMTWPIFVEMLLQMLVGNVDQIMLSHYSDTAVAAVGNANTIINVLILLFGVVSMASTILISQYLGAKETERVSQIYTLSLLVNVTLSLVVAGVVLLLRERMFIWMATPAELLPGASAYMAINGGLITLQAMFMSYAAIFRANALMKESMLVAAAINICNIVGNFILINGVPNLVEPMGVAGAAWSSCISRLVGVLIMMRMFSTRVQGKISLSLLCPFPRVLLKKLLALGLPSGGESLSYNLTQMCCLMFINLFGTAMVTTKVYAVMFSMLAYMYANSIAQASQIVTGYLVGAGRPDAAYARTIKTLQSSVPISAAIATLLFLCSPFLFGLFTDNPEILRAGRVVMGIEIVLETGRAVNLVLVRALQAVGDVRFPVVVGIGSQWLLSVLGGYLLGVLLGWGIAGIWVGMAIDECVRGVLLVGRWRSGAWRGRAQVQATG